MTLPPHSLDSVTEALSGFERAFGAARGNKQSAALPRVARELLLASDFWDWHFKQVQDQKTSDWHVQLRVRFHRKRDQEPSDDLIADEPTAWWLERCYESWGSSDGHWHRADINGSILDGDHMRQLMAWLTQ